MLSLQRCQAKQCSQQGDLHFGKGSYSSLLQCSVSTIKTLRSGGARHIYFLATARCNGYDFHKSTGLLLCHHSPNHSTAEFPGANFDLLNFETS